MLVEKIKSDLVNYLKAGDKLRISVTRLLIAAIKDKEISVGNNLDAEENLSDKDILEIIGKMIKQRQLTVKTYLDAKREDLAEKEEMEAKILSEYLPAQITEEELKKLIDKTIKELECNSIRDMGKIMKFLKENYSGSINFQKASELVKKYLIN